jgi:hypothetical protein
MLRNAKFVVGTRKAPDRALLAGSARKRTKEFGTIYESPFTIRQAGTGWSVDWISTDATLEHREFAELEAAVRFVCEQRPSQDTSHEAPKRGAQNASR